MDHDMHHDMDMDMGPTTPGMGGMGTTMHHKMGGMKMWFHGGTSDVVLFEFWKIKDDASMAYSCVIIFIMAFLYEGLKYFRESLYARQAKCSAHPGSSTSTAELDGQWKGEGETSWSRSVFRMSHLVQTFLHALQFFVSYLLMLIFMTYNSYLCLAVILGAAAGFFVFGWRKRSAVEITEHCH